MYIYVHSTYTCILVYMHVHVHVHVLHTVYIHKYIHCSYIYTAYICYILHTYIHTKGVYQVRGLRMQLQHQVRHNQVKMLPSYENWVMYLFIYPSSIYCHLLCIIYLPSKRSYSSATGAREYFSTTLPSGRPRWLIVTTLRAPLSNIYRMVGRAATILRDVEESQWARDENRYTYLWLLVIVLPSRGTLKSTLWRRRFEYIYN